MKKVWKSMDYSLLLPLVILCVLGVIMVYSSSSIVAISSRHNWPADYFFKKQLFALAVGTIMLAIIVAIPYKLWRKRIVLIAMGIGSIGLLAAAFLFGQVINGAKGWILGIQPAEFVKITVIITLANFLLRNKKRKQLLYKG